MKRIVTLGVVSLLLFWHQPAVDGQAGQYGVFALDVSGGSLYVGSEASLKNRPACEFKLGGNCGDSRPVTYRRLAGPFETTEEAGGAFCAGVTGKRRVPQLTPPLNLSAQWRGGAWLALVESSATGIDCNRFTESLSCRSIADADDLPGRWGVYAVNVAGGSFYVGTEESLLNRRGCEFKLGGPTPCAGAPAVTYQSLAGPFATRREARTSFCQNVTNRRRATLPTPLNLQGQWKGGAWLALVEPTATAFDCAASSDPQRVGDFVRKQDLFATRDIFSGFEGTVGEPLARYAIESARKLDQLAAGQAAVFEHAAFAKGSALYGKKTAGDFDEGLVLVSKTKDKEPALQEAARAFPTLAASLVKNRGAMRVVVVMRHREPSKLPPQYQYELYPNVDYNPSTAITRIRAGYDNFIVRYQEVAPGQGLASMVQHEATVFIGHRANGASCSFVDTLSGQPPGFHPAAVTRVGVQITDTTDRGVKPTWDFARSHGLEPRGSEVVAMLREGLYQNGKSFYAAQKYVKALKRIYQIAILYDDTPLKNEIIKTGVLEGEINEVNTIADRGQTVLSLLDPRSGLDPKLVIRNSQEFVRVAANDLDQMVRAGKDQLGLLRNAVGLLRSWTGQEARKLTEALDGMTRWIKIVAARDGKAFLDDYFKRPSRRLVLTGRALEILNDIANQLAFEAELEGGE